MKVKEAVKIVAQEGLLTASLLTAPSHGSGMSGARQWVGNRLEFGNNRTAYLARHSRLTEMRQEQPPQPAGRDLPGQISCIYLVADSLTKLERRRFEVAILAPSGCVRDVLNR